MTNYPNHPSAYGLRLSEAVRLGRRDGLEVLRDELAKRIEDPLTPAGSIAALVRRLESVLQQLEQFSPPEMSITEDLKRRREARRAEQREIHRIGQQHLKQPASSDDVHPLFRGPA